MWFRLSEALLEFAPDGERVVLFDKTTGETHFLNELNALVLSRISEEGCSLEQLVESLEEWSGTELEPESISKVKAALQALEDAELVEYRSEKAVQHER